MYVGVVSNGIRPVRLRRTDNSCGEGPCSRPLTHTVKRVCQNICLTSNFTWQSIPDIHYNYYCLLFECFLLEGDFHTTYKTLEKGRNVSGRQGGYRVGDLDLDTGSAPNGLHFPGIEFNF